MPKVGDFFPSERGGGYRTKIKEKKGKRVRIRIGD